MKRVARVAALVLGAALAPWPSGAAPEVRPIDGDYVYHTHRGDTLIGLSRRLLREPAHWHDLQVLNHVERPRAMPEDTALAIPYRWLRLSPETAEVVSVSGDVRVPAGTVSPGAHLGEGTVLETGSNGSTTLSMPDGSVLTVQRDSRLELVRLQRIDGLGAHDMSFALSAGRVETHVAPQHDHGRFEIRTPVAVTAVRGTRFRATFDRADANARTETLEGVVGVAASAQVVPVAAGFGTRVNEGAPPAPPRALLPPPRIAAPGARNASADVAVDFAPVEGAAHYRVQLAAEAGFYAPLRDEVVDAPRVVFADVADGEYWLRVRSITADGLEGTDATQPFVERRAPAPPALVAPVDGADLPGPDATFAFGAVAGATSYVVEVADEATFAEPRLARTVASPPWTVSGLPPGRHYWRAAAADADGVRGAYSTAQSFRTRALAPAPEVRLDGRHAELHWPAGGADAYLVEIARDASFRDIVDRALVRDGTYRSVRLKGGSYYARLAPRDDDGYAGAAGAATPFRAPFPAWLKWAPLVLVLPFL